ncbi:hypothetical protein MINTM020_24750 [Mycobacterium paraintracellulare]|nr:hypothetical protein MINTM020_24750 [Mycobacterium paraintracellulare]
MSDIVPLRTRLTEFFGIEQPVLLAPMALVSGGRLAAAVTGAGGLGLLGGGYGDPEWLQREFDNADSARIGCGFITWSLAGNPRALDIALAHQPRRSCCPSATYGRSPIASTRRASRSSLRCKTSTRRAGPWTPGRRSSSRRAAKPADME